MRSASPGLDFIATGGADFTGEKPLNEFYAEIKNVSLAPFVKHGRFHDYSVAGGIDVSVQGRNPDTLTGWVKGRGYKIFRVRRKKTCNSICGT